MKLFCPALIFSACILFFGFFSVHSQTTGTTSTGTIAPKKQPDSKKNKSVLRNVDFKNFTYPVPLGSDSEKSFTLKNGTSEKKEDLPKFTFRKTYYFDLTGDNVDEAITHIMADGCQLGCESSSLFYIHKATGDRQTELLWKIAIGGDTLGGLKAASFSSKEIVLDTFGDCTLEDWLIKTDIDVRKNPKLKPANFTRFVFSFAENGYSQTTRDVLPLTEYINTSEYRAKISFVQPD
jgi:hypothetical protein